MRLRQFEVFNAIMDVGSITGAGVALGLSQSSVTKILQHFESQLGLCLFERKSGRIAPTPEARRLFVDSARLVGHLNSVRRVAATLPGQGSGIVRVVATPSIAAALLSPAITSWRRRYPAERCEISSFHTRDMVTRLLLGEADLGLSLHNPGKDGLCARLLAEHHMLVAAPKGSWSAWQCAQPFPIAQLDAGAVALAGSDPLGALVEAALQAQDRQLDCRTVVQTHQLAGALAAHGHGPALIDPFTARTMDVQTRSTVPRIPVGLWLLARDDGALREPAQALARAVGQYARQLCAEDN